MEPFGDSLHFAIYQSKSWLPKSFFPNKKFRHLVQVRDAFKGNRLSLEGIYLPFICIREKLSLIEDRYILHNMDRIFILVMLGRGEQN